MGASKPLSPKRPKTRVQTEQDHEHSRRSRKDPFRILRYMYLVRPPTAVTGLSMVPLACLKDPHPGLPPLATSTHPIGATSLSGSRAPALKVRRSEAVREWVPTYRIRRFLDGVDTVTSHGLPGCNRMDEDVSLQPMTGRRSWICCSLLRFSQ